jgi:hypothetical protein
MVQPLLTREKVEEAIAEFDRKRRSSKEWQGWEDNKAHKYALIFKNRRYPVKQIASMAGGVPVKLFSGRTISWPHERPDAEDWSERRSAAWGEPRLGA